MKTTRRWLMAPLLAALVAAGCATAPPPAAQPLPTLPAAFRGAEGAWTQAPPAEAQARGEWWKAFGDPGLDALIEVANARSTQIEIAAARLTQARAALRGADADRLPQLGVAAGAGRGTDITTGTVPHTLLSAGANLSYELDLFGRLAKASDAAALDVRQREALLQSTRLVIQADVARNWFALRALDVERELVRETVAAYRDTLRLTERRFAAGDVAELDVVRVKTEAAANEADALAIERERSRLETALAVLTGEPATTFRAPDAGAWSGAPPRVPAGVPSTVLARRPDVAAAQNALLATQARLGVAQAAWFPDLTLTAGAGFASSELSDLFKWSARSWTVGALLSLPVFDGGRRAAVLASRGAEVDAATASYREQVLAAFKDVEDELSALQLLARQAEVQSTAVDAAARATTLSATRYRNGLVSQLELLDAQRSELRNRRQALQVRAAQYQATVALIRALGGGWG